MILQLSYELKTVEKDYSKLYSFLEKELATSSIHVLRDTWWVKYDGTKSISEICDMIKEKMGENDVFFLSMLDKNEINGWMASSNWKWLNE